MPTRKSSSKKSSTKKASTTKRSSAKSSTAKKGSAKKATTKKRSAAKRTLIEPHAGDKRYVRRNSAGQFKDEVNVGRSLSADSRSKAKTVVGPGQGDKGDTRRAPAKKK